MRKVKEIHIADSCFNKALPHELIFVLLGRDVAAPAAIRAWVNERISRGKNAMGDEQLGEAMRLASSMETELKHGMDHEEANESRSVRRQAEDVSTMPVVSEALHKFAEQPTAQHSVDVVQAIMESGLLRVARDQPTGVYLIAQERVRQVTVEGWDRAHDEQHMDGELAYAAACYANTAGDMTRPESMRPVPMGAIPGNWPWATQWWKPKSAMRNLARAGALIAAEMDRRLANGEGQ